MYTHSLHLAYNIHEQTWIERHEHTFLKEAICINDILCGKWHASCGVASCIFALSGTLLKSGTDLTFCRNGSGLKPFT